MLPGLRPFAAHMPAKRVEHQMGAFWLNFKMNVPANREPLVSVFIPSYQHAPYVRQAIESILVQTYRHFELIISDDGSSDGSPEIIQEYSVDDRISIRLLPENSAGEHNNIVFHEFRGEYFAVLNSDDYWAPDKLEKQVSYMLDNPHIGAVLSDADLIEEHNRPVGSSPFCTHNRTRAEWLRYFFTKPNCLCHPSMLIRGDLYRKLGGYRLSLSQLPDFEFWIRLLKHTDIYILPEKLVYFRWSSEAQNASSPTLRNLRKNRNERLLVLNSYFDNMADDVFMEAFSGSFVYPQAASSLELACEKAFLYLAQSGEDQFLYRMIGIQRLYALMENPAAQACLQEHYGFARRDFWKLMGDYDVKTGHIGQDEESHTLYAGANRLGSRLMQMAEWFFPVGSIRRRTLRGMLKAARRRTSEK